MEQQEIDDATDDDAVVQIADRAAHDERDPAAVARKLNAAPALYARTRLKNDVIGHSSPGRNPATIAYFVI
jgi:hypothetical protein